MYLIERDKFTPTHAVNDVHDEGALDSLCT